MPVAEALCADGIEWLAVVTLAEARLLRATGLSCRVLVMGPLTAAALAEAATLELDLVVEAGHWYAGKEIRIPTGKVERISYEESTVFVGLSKADIQRTDEDHVVHGGAQHQVAGNFRD